MPFQALVEFDTNTISSNSLAFSPFSVNSLFPKMYNMKQFLFWLNNLIFIFPPIINTACSHVTSFIWQKKIFTVRSFKQNPKN